MSVLGGFNMKDKRKRLALNFYCHLLGDRNILSKRNSLW
jgi:hypothetical protein